MDYGDRNSGVTRDYSHDDQGMSYSVGRAPLSPYLSIDPTYLNQGGAEFVFPTDSKKKRSWGEQMFSGIGTSYLCGITIGGSWGLYEGLRNPDGKTFKLRLNSVLNGCTRRGPFVANSLGIIALMYSSFDALIAKARGEEDAFNSIGAAVATGMVFKSTAGIRPIAIAGALGGTLATAYYFGEKLMESRGTTISAPNWA